MKIKFLPTLLFCVFFTMSVFSVPVFSAPPENPRIVNFDVLQKTIGKRGGTLEMLMAKPKDIRTMVIFSGARLITYNKDFELQADILQMFENEGNKTFTFKIRKGHKWSDGTNFTSEDFRYWWEDVAQNETITKGGVPQAMLVNGEMPKFEIIDERTVKYIWQQPNPLFLTALAGARPLYIYQPSHYMKQFHKKYADENKLKQQVEKEQVQNWGSLHIRKGRQYRPENPEMPSLQPWVNSTKLPSERIKFKRNEYFHRVDPNGTQLPYIDEMIINIVSKSIIAAKTGTGESHLQGRYLTFDNYPFLKKGEEEGNYKVHLWPSGRGSELTLLPNLNVADPIWQKTMRDVRVRRAISLAIDRTEINEALFFGLAKETGNAVLDSSPLYKDKYAYAWSEFNLEQANQLLDEAGLAKKDEWRYLPDGRKMEIIVETAGESSQETDILQLVADHLVKVGIGFFIKPSQRDILRQRVGSGEVVMSTWEGLNRGLATPDMNPEELVPASSVQGQWPIWGRYFETGGTGGEKPTLAKVNELVSLYEKWRKAHDRQTQTKIWHEMLDIFTDQAYTIGIVSGGLQPIVVQNSLKNVPQEGVWAFEPTHYFGHYLPDTFYFDE